MRLGVSIRRVDPQIIGLNRRSRRRHYFVEQKLRPTLLSKRHATRQDRNVRAPSKVSSTSSGISLWSSNRMHAPNVLRFSTRQSRVVPESPKMSLAFLDTLVRSNLRRVCIVSVMAIIVMPAAKHYPSEPTYRVSEFRFS
jgi:hypothetical protein